MLNLTVKHNRAGAVTPAEGEDHMKGYKPKKVESFRDKYSSTVVYEYRGHTYEVTYSNCWTYCCTPAWIQHRDEQARIDAIIDNPKQEIEQEIKSFDLDEIWEMLGW